MSTVNCSRVLFANPYGQLPLTHICPTLVSIIGWVAQRTGQSVEETAQAVGPGLAFFVVAEAMGLFGKAQNFMSVLFYVMLFSLGLVRLILFCMRIFTSSISI